MGKKPQKAPRQDQGKWTRRVLKRCGLGGKHEASDDNGVLTHQQLTETQLIARNPPKGDCTDTGVLGSDDTCAASPDGVQLHHRIAGHTNMWDEALKRVKDSEVDKKIINSIQSFARTSAEETHSGSQLQDLATIKKRMEQAIANKEANHKAEAWSVMIGSKEYSVRGFIEKTVGILNKFTPIADLAVSADPLHAALPWAAVRLVLMALSSGSKMKSEIAFGLTKVTMLVFHCDAYQKLYLVSNESSQQDYPVLSRLREAIIEAYVQSLIFLGFAHLQYSRGDVIALFKIEDMGTYIQKLMDVGSDLIQAANDCEKDCSHKSQARVEELFQLAAEIHEVINNQKKHISGIYKSVHLSYLTARLAEGAEYDSHDNENDPKCHKETRVDLLKAIKAWPRSLEGRPIYWLQGKAGTGKSTISRTIAQRLHDADEPGASFFFKRGAGDRSHAKRFFTTISSQLCRKWPIFAECVEEAICQDPAIVTKAFRQQFEKLILEPLQELSKGGYGILRILVVVDALDECDEDDHVKTIVSLLPKVRILMERNIYLKFFITSRPETHLRHGFKKIGQDHDEVVLHDISEDLIQRDLYTYLKYELSRIRDEYNEDDELPLEEDWPGDEIVRRLAQMASPLFIFAATVCRFLNKDPRDGLALVLDEAMKTHDTQLNAAYLPVLRRLLKENENSSAERNMVNRFQKIVGSIVTLEEPLSVSSLARLLDTDQGEIIRTIKPLDSVLNIPNLDSKLPIRIVHLSFHEFLIDKQRNKEEKFHVDQEKAHENLANKCLELLLRPGCLKEDICGLNKPARHRNEIDQHTIDNEIPPPVQYSCRYWIQHIIKGNVKIHDQHLAYHFLQQHFIHWIEVLCLIGRLSEGLSLIQELQTAINDNGAEKVLSFLRDANRFILHSYAAIDRTPLQLYSSALLFSPEESIVRKSFQKHIDWVIQKPIMESSWSPCLQTLDHHETPVSSVAISGNGKFIASRGYSGTVTVWDASKRVLRYTLEGSGGPATVALYDRGNLMACGSYNSRIKIWDTETGELQHTINNNDFAVSLAFSKGGRLASGSRDGKIKFWAVSSGKLEKVLQGHDGEVSSVAFSEENRLLASGSYDCTVKVWDAETGALKATLTGHAKRVSSVALSSNGKLLTSGSADYTVKIWDTATLKLRHTLETHGTVMSISFSRDSKLLAYTSSKKVEIWDLETQKLRQTLEGHAQLVNSVAFQDNGKMVSSSDVETIKIWDITQNNNEHTFQGNNNDDTSIAFSADGRLVASTSQDYTIKIWDAREATLRSEIDLKMHTEICSELFTFLSAFSLENKLLAAGFSNGQIIVMDLIRERLEWKDRAHLDAVRSIAFSADGKFMASGSDDKTVKVWDARGGSLLHTLEGHNDRVISIGFSPNATLLASLSASLSAGEIKIWNETQGILQKTIVYNTRCEELSFSMDGSHLFLDPGNQSINVAATLNSVNALDYMRINGSIQLSSSDLLGTRSEVVLATMNMILLQSDSYSLSMDCDWVTRGGNKLIWIHPDYRPSHYYQGRSWAISPSRKVIALGLASGRIIRIGF